MQSLVECTIEVVSMIKRTASRANMSLVNAAQEERINVSGGIVSNVPVTNLQTVKKSVNFELDDDGSYILRKPLILKERIINQDTHYLYDTETKVTLVDGCLDITGKSGITSYLKFYDKSVKEHTITNTSGLNFFAELINSYNANDHTLLTVKINHQAFYTATNHDLVHAPRDRVLYRFVKIYQNSDLGENAWVIEIVHPEFNTITAAMDEQGIDFNMLLDNPYAIRDLYNYGANGTTKILAYTSYNYDTDMLNGNIPVHRLTEDNPIEGKGFVILTAANSASALNLVYLKAFVTSAINNPNLRYYCCWERSATGTEWSVCPEFLEKYAASAYVEKKVSDITSEEFESLLFANKLTEAASYLVTKKLIPFENITDENDLIKDRPDVLKISRNNIGYHYRFCIYVDTGKTPAQKYLDKNVSKNYFTNINLDTGTNKDTFNTDESFEYSTSRVMGVDYSDPGHESADPYVENGIITLRPGKVINNDFYLGNSLTIQADPSKNIKIKKITFTIADALAGVDENQQPIQVQQSSNLGLVANKYTDYGTYGGTVRTSVSIIDTLLMGEDTSEAMYERYIEGAEDPSWNGTRIVLTRYEHGYDDPRAQEYEGHGPTGDDLFLGYQDLVGWFFEFTSSGIDWCGNSVNAGDIIIATQLGWDYIQNPQYFDRTSSNQLLVSNIANSRPVFAGEKVAISFEDLDVLPSKVVIYNTASANYQDLENHNLRFAGIRIDYEEPLTTADTTSTYEVSFTGKFKIQADANVVTVEDLSKQRRDIFYGEKFFKDGSYKFFAHGNVWYTDVDSMIVKALNILNFSTEVTKVLSYRNYFIVFTLKDISLVKFNQDNTYSIKLITSTIGLPKVDAKTPVVILNTVYFKSGDKIYRLVPNFYASNDDNLNIHIISTPIEELFSHIVNTTFESNNFGYTDTLTYRVFIPTNAGQTYCFIYDLERKAWTLQEYPLLLLDTEILAVDKAYVKSGNGTFFFFKDNLEGLLEKIRLQHFSEIGYIDEVEGESVDVFVGGSYIDAFYNENTRVLAFLTSKYSMIDAAVVYSKIPYGDYAHKTPEELYAYINEQSLKIVAENDVNFETLKITPISFIIDSGQKSSNYALDKQFLESKLIFATLHPKDMFPVTLDIMTDGSPRPIHWDCNTDSALWKTTLSDIGTLNTAFQDANADYNSILRQLIVKYSGKGKTIRHILTGKSKYRFKYISLNTRFRVLPNKQ